MSQKVDLWEKLKQNFRFPEGTHELVQENAFKIMGAELPMLAVRSEQEVYPTEVNSFP
jgi:hypothetical protein